MAQQRKLEFWYELASNYSYLSAMRIEELAAAAGVEVLWRPFLLGPIFKDQGWTTSPFNLYPAKGRYMIRDMERITRARGLDFVMPDPFPAPSLDAARIATALDEADVPAFSKAVLEAEFGEGKPIGDRALLLGILDRLGLDSAVISERSQSSACKERLRARVDEARQRGIFGAPSFVTPDGELYWGDDRLEMAIADLSRL